MKKTKASAPAKAPAKIAATKAKGSTAKKAKASPKPAKKKTVKANTFALAAGTRINFGGEIVELLKPVPFKTDAPLSADRFAEMLADTGNMPANMAALGGKYDARGRRKK